MAKKKKSPGSTYVDLKKEYNLDPLSKAGIEKARELAKKNRQTRFVCTASGCAEIAVDAAEAFGNNFSRGNAWDLGNRNEVSYTNPAYEGYFDTPGPLPNPTKFTVPQEVMKSSGKLVGLNRANNLVTDTNRPIAVTEANKAKAAANGRATANDSFDYANPKIYPDSRKYEHVGYLMDEGVMVHGTGPGVGHPAYYSIDDLRDGVQLPGVGSYQPVEMMEPAGMGKKLKNLLGFAKGGQKGSKSVEDYQRMLNDKYGAGLATDGAWGKGTQAAYERFILNKKSAATATPAVDAPAGEAIVADNSITKTGIVNKDLWNLDSEVDVANIQQAGIGSQLFNALPTKAAFYLRSLAGFDNTTENLTDDQIKALGYAVGDAQTKKQKSGRAGLDGSLGYDNFEKGREAYNKTSKASSFDWANFNLKDALGVGGSDPIGDLSASIGRADFKQLPNGDYAVVDNYNFKEYANSPDNLHEYMEKVGSKLGINSRTGVVVPEKYVNPKAAAARSTKFNNQNIKNIKQGTYDAIPKDPFGQFNTFKPKLVNGGNPFDAHLPTIPKTQPITPHHVPGPFATFQNFDFSNMGAQPTAPAFGTDNSWGSENHINSVIANRPEAPAQQPQAPGFRDKWNGAVDEVYNQVINPFSFTNLVGTAADVAGHFDNQRKSKEEEAYLRSQNSSDNLFSVQGSDRGDYVATGSAYGLYRPDQMGSDSPDGRYRSKFYAEGGMTPENMLMPESMEMMGMENPVLPALPSFTPTDFTPMNIPSTPSPVRSVASDYSFKEVKGEANKKAKFAYDYYLGKGLPQHVAAGIVGNLQQESGLNTKAAEKTNTANGRGIAQWDRRDRWKGLLSWAKKQDRDPYELTTQLDYVLEEPGEGAKALKKAMNTGSAAHAAVAWGRTYERPSEKHANWDYRATVAEKLHQQSRLFSEGGEYEVSEDELKQFLANGGEVEFL